MLGLPKATELNKQLPKNAIYAKFRMNATDKAKMDSDISRITIVNEVTSGKINVSESEQVSSFFVLLVILKKKDFDEKNIVTISKLISQNMLLILEYQGEAKLVVYHGKLIQTDWKEKKELSIELKGLNMNAVWENIILQVGNIQIEADNTLDEQLAVNEHRAKLQKEIERLKKQSKSEKQPKKKFEFSQRINKLKKEINEI